MRTGDALRLVRDKIRTDFLVVSCDLILNAPLHLFMDLHRVNDATVTMLLRERVKRQPGSVRAKRRTADDSTSLAATSAMCKCKTAPWSLASSC